jgi:hypothetical protein
MMSVGLDAFIKVSTYRPTSMMNFCLISIRKMASLKFDFPSSILEDPIPSAIEILFQKESFFFLIKQACVVEKPGKLS